MIDILDYQKILFPTDLSEHSDEAFAQAAALAARSGARLLMLHVVPERRPGALDWGDMPSQEELEESFEREARQRVTALEEVPEGLTVHQILQRGFPAECIVELAKTEGVDLIVMATHGRRGLSKLVLGSVTEEVLRNAPCDVITLRRREHGVTFEKLERILVPVDFSSHSERALALGKAMANVTGAEVQMLHAIAPVAYPAFYPPSATEVLEQNVDTLLERSEDQMETLYSELPGEDGRHSVHAAFGMPAAVILDFAKAKSCDLIVMGSHGRGGWEHALLGSVTERVLQRADRPIWVSRTDRGLHSARSAEIERALRDPARFFDTPGDVLARDDWTAEQRRRVLEQWKLDALRLESSASENMTGGEPALLREVALAMESLPAADR